MSVVGSSRRFFRTMWPNVAGAYGFVTFTEENARFYLNGGCELLDRFDIHLRDETCPIWSFQRRAELL